MDRLSKKDSIISMDAHKEKVLEKKKMIREFEEGPQPLPTCTCGGHTDPNQFLTEKQVTKHYLKDRIRYVKSLKGGDPLRNYMGVFDNLMGNEPLVRFNMQTQLDSMNYISDYFKRAMEFYKEYVKAEKDLSPEAEIRAKDLRIGYKKYKEYIVKCLINSYIICKLNFIRENYEFAWKKNELLNKDDYLDTSLNETEAYINYIDKHFRSRDYDLKMYIVNIAGQNLDIQVKERLKGNCISESDIDKLGVQLQKSLDMIEQIMSQNRVNNLATIKEECEEEKDNYNLEDKAKALIDIELKSREIEGSRYNVKSEFTANNSIKQLIDTIGMENIISKLSTKELETLFEQLK